MAPTVRRIVLALCLLGFGFVHAAGAQDDFGLGDGHEGLYLGAPVNRYTTLAASVAGGATVATVVDATGFEAGDLMMFWPAPPIEMPRFATTNDCHFATSYMKRPGISSLCAGDCEDHRSAPPASFAVSLKTSMSRSRSSACRQSVRATGWRSAPAISG